MMASKAEKDLRKAQRMVLGSAGALQAAPLLQPSGRTVPAMTRTAAGFVGLGVAGLTSEIAMDMITGKRRKRGRKRRR